MHCQICGRTIKAKTGLIAHHGYQRPGQGWQTRSCFGARYRPYEEAHDALDALIPQQVLHIDHLEKAQVEWVAKPPAQITDAHLIWIGRPVIHYDRPATFDAAKRLAAGTAMGRSYDSEWLKVYWQQRHAIKMAKETLKFLQERRAEWGQPRED